MSPPAKYRHASQNSSLSALGRARADWEDRDVVFVSLNTKWSDSIAGQPPRLLEIGLSYVDTSYLNILPPSTWNFKTRHFIINSNKPRYNSYYEDKSCYFRFGRSYRCQLNRARTAISELLSNWGDRVRLVTFHGKHDIDRFDELRIDLSGLRNYDVMKLDRVTNQLRHFRNLKSICQEWFDGPEEDVMRYFTLEKMGNAGNDAFFQLCVFRAMCFFLPEAEYH
ncbi:hypothetical protein NEOLI_000885 [Neolecta irregularis DAH-3]|uniref:Gfd2/YDR514C-like C-terminal domain-containing protein n=1 Tax=Neolecta irregularis (strain DAH-3) TaxID=1198029 RepID=A0A1U7LT33_NEOID|nr:hypothetical protein NEOLI_000885 [Neolecta irregularis DAH-3]|eukprot:OLL25702.1 hypothetical protein NEOLI_000885 [Neolecta irregularis DAH-3]